MVEKNNTFSNMILHLIQTILWKYTFHVLIPQNLLSWDIVAAAFGTEKYIKEGLHRLFPATKIWEDEDIRNPDSASGIFCLWIISL